MKLPAGGACGVTSRALTASRDMDLALAGRNSCATSMDAKPVTIGVTVAGGTWGPAAQQFALSDLHGMLICMQQLCVAGWAGSTQVPTDSSNTPSRVMATAVRWPIPHNMMPD
jgi:hypothetical protein